MSKNPCGSLYIREADGTIRVAKDSREWGIAFENTNNRVLKQENLQDGKCISTVFLGIDHSFSDTGLPILFETMVFDADGHELDKYRWATEEEATVGHELLVTRWRKA